MKQKEGLFYKLWQVFYPEGGALEERKDPHVYRGIERMYDIIQKGEPDYDELWDRVREKLKERDRRQNVVFRIMRYVAIVVVSLLGVGGGFLLFDSKEQPKELVSFFERPKNAIVLELSNGVEINLRESNQKGVVADRNVKIHWDSLRGLSYEGHTDVDSLLQYNTIKVPVAADYRLQLSDGTVVYLNSNSKLTYPLVFAEKERRVRLEGEGFFEVVKDVTRPFRVMVGESEVEVLGTSFNVNAYPEKEGIQTTLVEGRVKVMRGAKQVILSPGEQASCVDEEIRLSKVDVREFVSWKDGLFIFNRMSLEEIMMQMKRWYGLEVVPPSFSLKGYTFTGMIDKNLPAEETFKVIEKVVDLRFSLSGGKVLIIK